MAIITYYHFSLQKLRTSHHCPLNPIIRRVRSRPGSSPETAAVNAVAGRSAHAIFGSPDDLKFRSSMTLFARAVPKEPIFADALARYFDGAPDPRTLAKLGAG